MSIDYANGVESGFSQFPVDSREHVTPLGDGVTLEHHIERLVHESSQLPDAHPARNSFFVEMGRGVAKRLQREQQWNHVLVTPAVFVATVVEHIEDCTGEKRRDLYRGFDRVTGELLPLVSRSAVRDRYDNFRKRDSVILAGAFGPRFVQGVQAILTPAEVVPKPDIVPAVPITASAPATEMSYATPATLTAGAFPAFLLGA